jgi:hypothetical protein
VIGVEAARVDNAILLDNLTSEVVLNKPEFGSTDPNILIDNNCTDDELHFGMRGDSGDHEDDGDESDEHDAILNASHRGRAVTELEKVDLGTSDVDEYLGEDGNAADEEEEA